MKNEQAIRVLAGTIQNAKDAERVRASLNDTEAYAAVLRARPRVATFDVDEGVKFYAVLGEGKENIVAQRLIDAEGVLVPVDAKPSRLPKNGVLRDMETAGVIYEQWTNARAMLADTERRYKEEVEKDAPLTPSETKSEAAESAEPAAPDA